MSRHNALCWIKCFPGLGAWLTSPPKTKREEKKGSFWRRDQHLSLLRICNLDFGEISVKAIILDITTNFNSDHLLQSLSQDVSLILSWNRVWNLMEALGNRKISILIVVGLFRGLFLRLKSKVFAFHFEWSGRLKCFVDETLKWRLFVRTVNFIWWKVWIIPFVLDDWFQSFRSKSEKIEYYKVFVE